MIGWNEIRDRATKFAREWAGETRETGEYQSFWNEFFDVFGVRRRSVAYYQTKVALLKQKRGFIDLFWPGTLLVEHKSAGEDLDAAFTQATDYFEGLSEEERPRFVIVSDYARIRLYDLEGENGKMEQHDFLLKELPKYAKLFGFIAGYEVKKYREEDPINVKAVQAIGKLHDALKASGYAGHDLELFLTRLVFCFFSDDAGIFEKDQLQSWIEYEAKTDGSDFGLLFQVLDTPVEKRQSTLSETLMTLQYVNGGLFKERISIPVFDRDMWKTLLDCMKFDWSNVSPAVFGSMFQSVMDEKARHDLGAHYTSEKNILKVIDGLFLDELHAEFQAARGNKTKLLVLRDKMEKLKFLDPACGCGNFLVVAYRELRRLELEIIKVLYAKEIQNSQSPLFDAAALSSLNVDMMYGIEIEEFPARVAQLALWLTDHQMNRELSTVLGKHYARLPLDHAPHIVNGNALQLDWEAIVPKNELSYIMGNPPFLGHHLQTEQQKEELESALHNLPNVGVMDFVTGWYAIAANYIQGTKIQCGFVSTNSISQGEQVGILWGDVLRDMGLSIHFAHRTFRWSNEARGKAAVYCVIIGFATFPAEHPRLFDYPDIGRDPHEIPAKHINPYLVDAPDILIRNRSHPICDVPEMMYGSKPTDGGFFLFSDKEKEELLTKEPGAEIYIRKYVSGEDFLYGESRWCLWLVGAKPEDLRRFPEVMKRVEMVKSFRLASKAASTRNYPHHTLFRQVTQPNAEYILVPSTTSETRRYIPLGFLPKDVILSNASFAIPGATPYHFGVLESEMHMTWMRAVCGRLKSDYRYSKDIVYNNFPWPEKISAGDKQAIEQAAQGVLTVRKEFPNSTLADLYDPLTMPKGLLDAHHALDRAVDRAYIAPKFTTEAARLEFLFKLYKELSENK